MGSVCFAVVAFKEDLSETESLHIAGAGCILFLISAFFQHVTNYKSTGRFLDRAEELNAVFLSIVKEQSMRTSIMRRGGNNMAISDASMRRVSENAEEDSNIKEACHQVFESFDRQGKDGAGDGNLDFIELYEALSGFGIVIELDVLRFIFNQADVNGDKSLQPEEFVRYIFSIKRSKTPQERRREIIRAMSKTTYFWMCWLQVFAGFVITLVNYYDMSAETARNWSLAGNFSWMIPVIWYLWVIVRGHVDYFEASSRSKIHLKEFFLSEATKTQHTSTSVLISARVLYRGAMPPH